MRKVARLSCDDISWDATLEWESLSMAVSLESSHLVPESPFPLEQSKSENGGISSS